MKGRPDAYEITVEQIVRGLFDATSHAAMLLDLACANHIELHATPDAWNDLLWLLSRRFVEDDGEPMFDGVELRLLRSVIPVDFH